jgi:hypothetical protein
MDLQAWIDTAWEQHGSSPAAVAARLPTEGLPLLLQGQDDAHLAALARLAHHVHGPHLARWQEGQRLQEQLAALPFASAASRALITRLRTSLALAAGEPGARAALSPPDRVAVAALAANNLAEHDSGAAQCRLEQAVAEAQALALPDADPALRTIAASANNVAGALQDLPARSAAQTELMLHAATVARRFWARAGTWREVERAEYRLALCHAVAGDGAAAREHARACLDIVAANGHDALEAFFGHEAMARAEHAAGNAAARAAAVAAAAAVIEQVPADDRPFCEPTLAQLRAL